jgi:hypothetical protein
VGTRGGAETNPAWVHNLRANPNVHADIGTESYELSRPKTKIRGFKLSKNPIHRAMTIPSGSLLEWLIIATFG